jgi:hypothetical protein
MKRNVYLRLVSGGGPAGGLLSQPAAALAVGVALPVATRLAADDDRSS